MNGAVPTHILFDFFGTLAVYDDSHTAGGLDAPKAIATAGGCTLDENAFELAWLEIWECFTLASRDSHREFSLAELALAR